MRNEFKDKLIGDLIDMMDAIDKKKLTPLLLVLPISKALDDYAEHVQKLVSEGSCAHNYDLINFDDTHYKCPGCYQIIGKGIIIDKIVSK